MDDLHIKYGGSSLAINKVRTENRQVKELSWGICLLKKKNRGTWVAQLVERLTSAHVMISRSVSSSPASGSVLTAQPGARFGFCVSLSLSLSLSAPALLMFYQSLYLKNE